MKKIVTDTILICLIKDFNDGYFSAEMSLKYGINACTINRILKKNGFFRNHKDAMKLAWAKGKFKNMKHVSWNQGLTKYTDTRLVKIGQNISRAKKGKQIAWNKGIKNPNISKRNRIDNPMWKLTSEKKELHRKKISESSKTLWANEEFRNKQIAIKKSMGHELNRKMRIGSNIVPNKSEMIMIKLIDDNKLPFKYVGDGSLYISNKNPDFVHKTKKKILEVFGEFWHRDYKKVVYHRTENGCKELYHKNGYSCLIIWVNDLIDVNNHKKIVELIRKFEKDKN